MPGIAFFGYGELGVAGIEALASSGAAITAVVVPSNRSGADVDIVSTAAQQRGIPTLVQPPRRDIPPFLNQLRALAPDVIIVWSYSMLLPAEVLNIPRRGAVNVHSGLLPQYRGGHVIQWAIVNGEAESGVTLHFMDERFDTGPVIAQARFALDAQDDAMTVREKLRKAGESLLREWRTPIESGTAPRVAQDEARARHWPLRRPEEGRIDWNMTSDQISRLVRALVCNTPGAYVTAGNRHISIRRVTPLPSTTRAEPGRVVGRDADGVRIATRDGVILVSEAVCDGTILRGDALADCFDHA